MLNLEKLTSLWKNASSWYIKTNVELQFYKPNPIKFHVWWEILFKIPEMSFWNLFQKRSWRSLFKQFQFVLIIPILKSLRQYSKGFGHLSTNHLFIYRISETAFSNSLTVLTAFIRMSWKTKYAIKKMK